MKEQFKIQVDLLPEEQQKEYNYIDGKIKRRGPVYPYEYVRWRELRAEAEKAMLSKFDNKNKYK